MDVQTCKQLFLDSVAAGRAESPRTFLWYRRRLGRFLDWAVEHHPQHPLSKRAFNGFVAHLKQRVSSATLRGYVIILRRFGRWLVAEGIATSNPAEDLSAPRGANRVPKGISPQEVGALLNAARNPRDRAMILMLRETGARANELMGLRWKDVDLEQGVAWVRGKGGKERPVFFRDKAKEALKLYREQVPHAPEDPVWWQLNLRKPLSYWGLYGVLKRLAKKANVKRYNPHAFRHAFGRDMTRNGCPTLVLQDLMGHASPETTRIYARLSYEDLKNLHGQYAP